MGGMNREEAFFSRSEVRIRNVLNVRELKCKIPGVEV